MDTETRHLGKYELRERLARGGQGEVWKAFDPHLRRYVAIKQLHANLQSDPDFISRFEREARFIAALHHPNIVQIHDFQSIQTPGSDNTTAYMVMDYIEGPTLANYIHNTSHKRQFPDPADIVYIFTAVSLAIDYAHQKGMIHRDIKPANIMLDKRSLKARSMGQPILTDFGIAKLQGASGETTRTFGTPLYASPEQARGLSVDKRSDLYSLGIILYEMTTGVTPFGGDSPLAIFMQHYQEMPPPPASINPTIPPALSEVILKSIAKNPDARFQSASAMTIALAEALNVPVPSPLRPGSSSDVRRTTQTVQPSPAPATIPLPSPPTTQRQPIKRLMFIGLIALLLIAFVVGVGSGVLYALRPNGPPAPTTSNSAVGKVLFLSSQNPPRSLDEVQITFFHGIPNAPSGMTYYAWLENVDNSMLPVSWSLTVHNSSLSPSPFTYIDRQHRNLLTTMTFPNLFLITQQIPGLDHPTFITSDRRYYAKISQTTSSMSFPIMPCPQNNSNNICIQ